MMLNDFKIRACYADTDAAGVIHHARYLEFFERSRTEWLARMGAGPADLEAKLGHVLAIRETILTFHQPGRLDDLLIFSHTVTHKGRSQLTLQQKVFRFTAPGFTANETDLLVTASFQLVCVDMNNMKSTALPEVF